MKVNVFISPVHRSMTISAVKKQVKCREPIGKKVHCGKLGGLVDIDKCTTD